MKRLVTLFALAIISFPVAQSSGQGLRDLIQEGISELIESQQSGDWQDGGEWHEDGEWQDHGNWQPVEPTPVVKPGYRIVERHVQVYNPQTGQYETRIIREQVPIHQPVQPGAVTVTVTFTNHYPTVLTIGIGSHNHQLQPNTSWRVSTTHGQQYSYTGPSRQNAQGHWISGVTKTGTIDSSRPVIKLIKPQPQPVPQPGRPAGSFVVTFDNNTQHVYTVAIGSQTHKVQPGLKWQTYATEGQGYDLTGEPYSTGPGQMVGGGVFHGTVSSSNPIISMGGPSQPTPAVPLKQQVTFVNRLGGYVTLDIGDHHHRLGHGQSWAVEVSVGQHYSYTGDPRQTGPNTWVGGAVGSGEIPAHQKTITLGNGQ